MGATAGRGCLCLIVLSVMLSLVGCGSRAGDRHADSHADRQIFIFATLSVNEIRQIIDDIQSIDPEPILMIKDEERNGVDLEVSTGVVRGPLDGGGKTYHLQRKGAKWVVISTGMWVS